MKKRLLTLLLAALIMFGTMVATGQTAFAEEPNDSTPILPFCLLDPSREKWH